MDCGCQVPRIHPGTRLKDFHGEGDTSQAAAQSGCLSKGIGAQDQRVRPRAEKQHILSMLSGQGSSTRFTQPRTAVLLSA